MVAFLDTSNPQGDFMGDPLVSAAIFNDELMLQLEDFGQLVINRATGSVFSREGASATARCTWEIQTPSNRAAPDMQGDVADLLRRIAELEARVTALEQH